MSWELQFSSPVHLYQLKNGNIIDKGPQFTISILSKRDFSAKFQIFETQMNEVVLEADIKSALNLQFSSNERRVFFDIQFNNRLYNFSLVFALKKELTAFIRVYATVLFENSELRFYSDEDKEEIDRYVLYMSLDDVDDQSQRDSDDDMAVEYVAQGKQNAGRNTLLATSEKTLNSLVLRKYDTFCSLGMFELDKDCKFKQAIPKVETEVGDLLLVNDMLTINQDKNLVLLDDNNDKIIYNMDLVRGDVVSHYDTKYNGAPQPVVKLMPTNARGDDSTFLGFNSRNTLRFDPRIEQLVEKSDYKTDNHFTCGATSVNGKVALGAKNGVIRLYNGPCKTRATTNFQANVGDQPIKSLDISPDEEWVLAACPYYLSLINTKNETTGRLAFDASMGKNKPPCMRLVISQEHQQLIANYHDGMLPEFSTAKFDLLGSKVVNIVGSIGTAIVSWNFKRIVSGKKPTYKISLVGGETVVDNQPIELTRDVLFMSENQLSMIDMNK